MTTNENQITAIKKAGFKQISAVFFHADQTVRASEGDQDDICWWENPYEEAAYTLTDECLRKVSSLHGFSDIRALAGIPLLTKNVHRETVKGLLFGRNNGGALELAALFEEDNRVILSTHFGNVTVLWATSDIDGIEI